MKITARQIAIASVILNILTFAVIIGKRMYYSNKKDAPKELIEWSNNWNKQRQDLYSAHRIQNNDIVLLGDSHFEQFLSHEYYPCMGIVNRGIGSNTTQQVLDRLPAILNAKPGKVFLLIGINDLIRGYSTTDTYNNIIRIADQISAAGCRPFIVSLLPIAGDKAYLNDSIIALNKLLLKYCTSKSINYIDEHVYFYNGQQLNPFYTIDSVHLNSRGYGIFVQKLDSYLKL